MTGRHPPLRTRKPVIAVRVPEPTYRRIKDAVKTSGRSMSDEIALRLDLSFDNEGIISRLDRIEELVRRSTRRP